MSSEKLWNSLEVTKIVASLLTPLLIFWLGFTANQYLDQSNATEVRKSSAQEFSRFIYERRVRAELLASALRRHSTDPNEISFKEVHTRKRDYDQAYASWNKNNLANLLAVRTILEIDEYSRLENLIEFRLVGGAFRPLDHCLTAAYDAAIRENNARKILEDCDVSGLLQVALDCGYAISDELYRLSEPKKDTLLAESIIEQRCPGDAYPVVGADG